VHTCEIEHELRHQTAPQCPFPIRFSDSFASRAPSTGPVGFEQIFRDARILLQSKFEQSRRNAGCRRVLCSIISSPAQIPFIDRHAVTPPPIQIKTNLTALETMRAPNVAFSIRIYALDLRPDVLCPETSLWANRCKSSHLWNLTDAVSASWLAFGTLVHVLNVVYTPSPRSLMPDRIYGVGKGFETTQGVVGSVFRI
jgi:hypothetical protein